MNHLRPITTALLTSALFALPQQASAQDTYAQKDTVATVAASVSGDNFYFWTSTTIGTCNNGTKWMIADVNDPGGREIARLAEMAFMSGSRVAMDYTCSGNTAIVNYLKVYR